MSYTLKILKKVEKSLEKKREKINYLLTARPLSEICQIRIKFQDILQTYGTSSKEAMDFANENVAKEQKLFSLAKKQVSTMKHVDELVEVEHELAEIRKQMFLLRENNPTA